MIYIKQAFQFSNFVYLRDFRKFFLTVLFMLLSLGLFPANAQDCATPGKDGNGSLAGIVNTYYPGATNSSASSTSIPVGLATGALNSISPGDLLLIIQMQDAPIATTNSSSYGTGFAGGVAGFYEYVVATNSVSSTGGTITTATALTRTYYNTTYTPTQRKQSYQVVLVPQYADASLSGDLTAPNWNGSSGGIVVLDVAGTFTLNSKIINVKGKGFRGGGGRTISGGSGTNTDYRFTPSVNNGASKGEGIAGTPRYTYNGATVDDNTVEGYLDGSYGRGAPGNAGGGGNDGDPASNSQNSGGGGGSNYGTGGQGGRSWSSSLDVGGTGGYGFTSAAIDRVILGGGGGAATTNNGAEATASGAAGGGIVIVRTKTISGTGTINANGDNALKSAPTCCDDGAGGGGAGGSVVLISSNTATLSSFVVSADGGNGGDTLKGASPHGPGGGGGGGTVLANGALGGISIAGGINGTTDNDPTYGTTFSSTPGSSGNSNTTVNPSLIPGTLPGFLCTPPTVALIKATSHTTRSPGEEITYTVAYSNDGGKTAQVTKIIDAIPPDTEFKIGSATASSGGVTYEYSNDFDSTTGSGTWTYSPTGTTYDPNVKALRFVVGNLSNAANGNVTFVVRVK
jgi:uncharacterized repeat protein (TIGR01451 family)